MLRRLIATLSALTLVFGASLVAAPAASASGVHTRGCWSNDGWNYKRVLSSHWSNGRDHMHTLKYYPKNATGSFHMYVEVCNH